MNAEDILKKYGRKIESEIQEEEVDTRSVSREFIQFKKDLMPRLSRYEGWCNSLGNIINIKMSGKDEAKIQKQIDIAHLNITPRQALTLAILAFIVTFFAGLLISLAIYLMNNSFSLLLLFLTLLSSVFFFYYIKKPIFFR